MIYPGDQVALPGEALYLPDSKASEQQRPGQAKRKQATPLAPARIHGAWFIGSLIKPGIMFEFRWYMIHSEPPTPISNRTAVKT